MNFFYETLRGLKEGCKIVAYHGTTVEIANKIKREGFKKPNPNQIIKDAYAYCGIQWEERKKFPRWLRAYMEGEGRVRIISKYYHTIHFGTYGVAVRWAGIGGEVFHELIRSIKVGKLFYEQGGRTEKEFDDSHVDFGRYEIVGEGAVVEARIKLSVWQCKQVLRAVQYHISQVEKEEWTQRESEVFWDNTYVDWQIRDPRNIKVLRIIRL